MKTAQSSHVRTALEILRRNQSTAFVEPLSLLREALLDRLLAAHWGCRRESGPGTAENAPPLRPLLQQAAEEETDRGRRFSRMLQRLDSVDAEWHAWLAAYPQIEAGEATGLFQKSTPYRLAVGDESVPDGLCGLIEFTLQIADPATGGSHLVVPRDPFDRSIFHPFRNPAEPSDSGHYETDGSLLSCSGLETYTLIYEPPSPGPDGTKDAGEPNPNGLVVIFGQNRPTVGRLLISSPLPGLLRGWIPLSREIIRGEWNGRGPAPRVSLAPRWYLRPQRRAVPGILHFIREHPATVAVRRQIEAVIERERALCREVIPLVESASWKRHAAKVMHEVASLAGDSDSSLEAIRSSLLQTIATASQIEGTDGEDSLLLEHLRSAYRASERLARVSTRTKSKIHWYFYLASGERRGGALVRLSLLEGIRATLGGMGYAEGTDFRIEDADAPEWTNTTYSMPEAFFQHSLEAILRNAFRHKSDGSRVAIRLHATDGEGTILEWENLAEAADREFLRNGDVSRSFGIFLAREVARETLGAGLEVTVDDREKTIRHRLRLRPCPSDQDSFFDCKSFARGNRTTVPSF